VALLRTEAGRDPYDRGLTDLVGELSTRSEEFRVRWATHDVRFHRTGVKHFHHPVVGDLTLTYEALDFPADPGLRIFAYTAEPNSPSHEALNLLASWASTPDRSPRSKQTKKVDDPARPPQSGVEKSWSWRGEAGHDSPIPRPLNRTRVSRMDDSCGITVLLPRPVAGLDRRRGRELIARLVAGSKGDATQAGRTSRRPEVRGSLPGSVPELFLLLRYWPS
jgi:hypothetical protein